MPADFKDILLQALSLFVRAVEILVLVRVLMSWFPVGHGRGNDWFHRARETVWRLTEPFLDPIRRLLPMGSMGIDFSPLVLLLLLGVVYRFVAGMILRF